MRAEELLFQRRQTEAMLTAEGVEIVLTRRPEVPDGAGGTTEGPPTNLPPQRMSIIESAPGYGGMEVVTGSGDVAKVGQMVFSEHDLDIQKNDTFVHAGKDWTVETVDRNDFRTVAKVESRDR